MNVKKLITTAFILIFLGSGGAFFVRFYGVLFAKTVHGKILTIENTRFIQSVSFSIALKTDSGEILASTSKDLQWSAVEKGNCVIAKFFPYPPWDIERGGDYATVKLVRIIECEALIEH